MKLKGIRMLSHNNQIGSGKQSGQNNPNRALPSGHQYIGRPGMASRARHLRQMNRKILKSKDPEVIAIIERARLLTKDEKYPEFAFQKFIREAFMLADVTDLTLTVPKLVAPEKDESGS